MIFVAVMFLSVMVGWFAGRGHLVGTILRNRTASIRALGGRP